MPRTEFYLASIMTNPEEVGDYIAEAKQLGIDILPPDINYSETDICIKDNKIYYGFSNIKHVGRSASNYLVKLREKAIQCSNGFKSRQQLDNLLEDQMIYWEYRDGKRGKSPKQKLGSGAIDALDNAGCFDRLEPCPDLRARALLQQDLLGIVFVDIYTPLTAEYEDDLLGSKPATELSEHDTDCYGILSAIDVRKTRASSNARFSNKEYAVLTLDWMQKTAKVTCFTEHWLQYQEDLVIGSFWRLYVSTNAKGTSVKAMRRID